MKTLLTILVLSLVAFTSYAQKPSMKALDEKNGFRDAHFGADTTAYSDLVFSTIAKPLRMYKRSNDSKKIGNAEADNIIYGFYKGKLGVILIATQGKANTNALYEALSAQYGNGMLPSTPGGKITWWTRKVYMTLKQNSINGDGLLTISSRPIEEQMVTEDKEAAKKAASDL